MRSLGAPCKSGLLGIDLARHSRARLPKGPSQNGIIDAYLRHRAAFEDIPFDEDKSGETMRDRLQQILVAAGLIRAEADIDELFLATERVFGWASLIRCSVGIESKNPETGETIYVAADSAIMTRTIKSRRAL